MGFDITGLGSAFEFAKGIMDRFWPTAATEAEKLAALASIAPMLEQRENQLIEAQKEIIVAEMSQGDVFTKRARPMVVYMGLAFIGIVHVLFPCLTFFFRQQVPTLTLPEEFWWAWSSVVGIWAIGRSLEKSGATSKIVGMITGK